MIGKLHPKEFIKTAKWKIFGKSEYGKFWKEADPDFWHNYIPKNPNPLIREDIKRYISSKKKAYVLF